MFSVLVTARALGYSVDSELRTTKLISRNIKRDRVALVKSRPNEYNR
jgi:hypothetical protein